VIQAEAEMAHRNRSHPAYSHIPKPDFGAHGWKKMYIMRLLRSLPNGFIVLASLLAGEFRGDLTQGRHSASR